MSTRQLDMTDRLEAYVLAHSREGGVAARLRAETAKLPPWAWPLGLSTYW